MTLKMNVFPPQTEKSTQFIQTVDSHGATTRTRLVERKLEMFHMKPLRKQKVASSSKDQMPFEKKVLANFPEHFPGKSSS